MVIKEAPDFYEKEHKMREIAEFLWPRLCDFWNVPEYKDKMPKIELALVSDEVLRNYHYKKNYKEIEDTKPVSTCNLFLREVGEKKYMRIEVKISINDVYNMRAYCEELTHSLRDLYITSKWLKSNKSTREFSKEYDSEVEEWFGALGDKATYHMVKGTKLEDLFSENPNSYNKITKKVREFKERLGELCSVKDELISYDEKGISNKNLNLEHVKNLKEEFPESYKRFKDAGISDIRIEIAFINRDIEHLENWLMDSHARAKLNADISVEELLKKEPNIIKKPNKCIKKHYLKRTISSI